MSVGTMALYMSHNDLIRVLREICRYGDVICGLGDQIRNSGQLRGNRLGFGVKALMRKKLGGRL